MQVYLVGGAVRDGLLGLPIKDKDWVVVGATPQEMLDLGFEAVGKDFPVFLHPKSREEYALARTERKIGAGYHGFQFNTAVDVTLEQDLQRRDLTINAMAQDADGNITDPYLGQQDLHAGMLRHVSAAFSEDPVRILRVGRFAARFDFQVAAETMVLMQKMVDAGEVDALVPERVWQELSKALLEPQPQRFFEVLSHSHALHKILQAADTLQQQAPDLWQNTLQNLQGFSPYQHLSMSYAILCLHLPPPLQTIHQSLRVPKDCADAANILQDAYPILMQTEILSAEQILSVFQRCDVWRRPERWQQLWQTCITLAALTSQTPPPSVWPQALAACLAVNTAQLALQCEDKRMIANTIHTARLAAITQSLQ
ncbi:MULTISPECIES: hypothetical protein [Vitreoscilla]|uniref:Multifunctional CCA tRNA nucleotidyl transferase/2'3'-cyclic phosphodiesterase/2'nucleotidase/phosphatase n=1 Tax=Vitreoscilla stercoraria TaxID=61 RepID=A0ABY4E6L3_VITST|nr:MULTISPECIES: hypothetical protein [Vitreoscilla]AUZ04932.2 multifunctional CCA protein [Vitreoscilla sp. C1]UOO91419.1 multifunctional CCA tRNA nucleotidyl transferase/2'3'-cyclic phosphodiesterase/2'nucleotidase/phosphatase [Vitreoscilla stercoraria]